MLAGRKAEEFMQARGGTLAQPRKHVLAADAGRHGRSQPVLITAQSRIELQKLWTYRAVSHGLVLHAFVVKASGEHQIARE